MATKFFKKLKLMAGPSLNGPAIKKRTFAASLRCYALFHDLCYISPSNNCINWKKEICFISMTKMLYHLYAI